jgi:hypothetical protein
MSIKKIRVFANVTRCYGQMDLLKMGFEYLVSTRPVSSYHPVKVGLIGANMPAPNDYRFDMRFGSSMVSPWI